LGEGRSLRNWRIQGTRFVIVGLASNILLYLVYLLITAFGVRYKVAMTMLYVIGTLQTFALNARWTFKHTGHSKASLVKYVLAYGACYLINISALIIFVDRIGLPHQVVQGVMILTITVVMFLLQKFWVFTPSITS
jgi:putative flippase GtrA